MYYPVTHTLSMLKGIGVFGVSEHATLGRRFERLAVTQPDSIFLRYEERSFSYAQANALINRYAHAYRAHGVGKGDVVALLLENRPEFLWHVFGLHKLGAVASLINTHLVGDSLVHAIRICGPQHVVIGSEVWDQFAGVRADLAELPASAIDVDLDPHFAQTDVASIWGDRLSAASEQNPTPAADVRLSDQAAFIYTSGTTGLPKAAIVRHARFFRAGTVWAGLAFRYRSGDVLYNCLPLYHANSLLLATSSVISAGVTMALTRRFSRSRFWDEVRRFDANCFIYIGELCRYLMNNPAHPRDRDHRVHAISGNGLRPEIWREFKARFGIDRIVEFYGATEGNCITLNAMGVTGSVGPKLPGMALARWDEASGTFVRDAHGRVVKTRAGEPGVLLGRIRRNAEFDGYQDRSASESKVVRNAFADGDAWFNTGDLLRLDHLRHLHFVDRLGDTFRWKGENVATSEVQDQLSAWPAVQEANVYGVTVPGVEGRAGMAALVLQNGDPFDPSGLRSHLQGRLASYARPQFVRIMPELSVTSTFKLKKDGLQKEGYDPRQVGDPLYLLHPEPDQYVPLTPELYDQVMAGKLRL
jgi:acyl-CoA synthetase (AMP-forming)/AMP-acid ligase II